MPSSESQTETEKDLRYKLIQKFKKMQERQIAKETTKLKSLVSGKLFRIISKNNSSSRDLISLFFALIIEASQLSKNAINGSSVSSDTASENEYHDNRTDDRYRLHEDNGQLYHLICLISSNLENTNDKMKYYRFALLQHLGKPQNGSSIQS